MKHYLNKSRYFNNWKTNAYFNKYDSFLILEPSTWDLNLLMITISGVIFKHNSIVYRYAATTGPRPNTADMWEVKLCPNVPFEISEEALINLIKTNTLRLLLPDEAAKIVLLENIDNFKDELTGVSVTTRI